MPRPAAFALCSALLLSYAAPRPAHAQPATAEGFRPVLDALYAALARGDTAALRPQLADDLVWVDGVTGREATKVQVLAAFGGPRGPSVRYERDSLRVQAVGGVALVGYRRVDRRAVGGYESTARWRVHDVFAERGGRWQLVRHTRTWLVAPVAAGAVVALDSAALQPFVGRYHVAPGYVDDVHWEGGHLVATVTGYPPGDRLVPVSGAVFSPAGTGALIAFERDSAGRVVGYVQGYPDGRVVRRPKLPKLP